MDFWTAATCSALRNKEVTRELLKLRNRDASLETCCSIASDILGIRHDYLRQKVLSYVEDYLRNKSGFEDPKDLAKWASFRCPRFAVWILIPCASVALRGLGKQNKPKIEKAVKACKEILLLLEGWVIDGKERGIEKQLAISRLWTDTETAQNTDFTDIMYACQAVYSIIHVSSHLNRSSKSHAAAFSCWASAESMRLSKKYSEDMMSLMIERIASFPPSWD